MTTLNQKRFTVTKPEMGPYPETTLTGGGLYVDDKTGKTFFLLLSDKDRGRFDLLPGGRSKQSVEVTDLITGTVHTVQRGPCGLGCYCGARFA